jgi:hypothetical protein
MPKFTLICDHGNEKTTVEFEKEYLPEVLENLEMFLRGAGYHFNGTLDFVDDEYTDQEVPAKGLYFHV